ncbi:MAG: hypothetical protein NVSMB25_20650 [Thermoleophilaceae bacterium]
MATQTRRRTSDQATQSRRRNSNKGTQSRHGTSDQERPAQATANSPVAEIRELNERIIDSAKRAGNAYLDAYEKTAAGFAAYEERFAEASSVEWVSTLATAQAELARDLTGAYSSAARTLLR